MSTANSSSDSRMFALRKIALVAAWGFKRKCRNFPPAPTACHLIGAGGRILRGDLGAVILLAVKVSALVTRGTVDGFPPSPAGATLGTHPLRFPRGIPEPWRPAEINHRAPP